MKVTFRSGQELVKVGEIGELIVEADCAFRLEIVRAVLAELRSDWEKLPLRKATGLKHPARGLSVVKQSMHDRAMRYAESRAYAKNLEVDAAIDALGIELKCLEQKEIRGGIAGPSMQEDIDGVQLRMKTLQLLKAHYLQEAQEEALGKAADNIDAFVRDEYVRVSELAAWLRVEHGFDCQSYAAADGMAASSTSTDGEIAQMLGKWFDSPISDLPPKLREIAEAYIPNWPELSGAERRARADEADHQVQATLGHRFEKARMDAEQANAATPARFKERQFQYGFNKVGREKNGERDFEAKRGAVSLSDERCFELARMPEFGIEEWIELTGVGLGEYCGFFFVAPDGVSFIKHEHDFIKSMSREDQIYMLRDNRHEPLKFPSTPARILDFLDSELCTILGCFSAPDSFRQAVTERAKAIGKAPLVSGDAEKTTEQDTTGMVAWQAVIIENWSKIAEECGKKPSARQVMTWLRDKGENDVFPKDQPRFRDSLRWQDSYGQVRPLTIKRLGTVISEWRRTGRIPA
jgi:hypothetical protein